MFRKPINVELGTAPDTTVNHKIALDLLTIRNLSGLVTDIGVVAVMTFAGVTVLKTSSEIAIHIAKTKIK